MKSWLIKLNDTGDKSYSYLYEISTKDETKQLQDAIDVYEAARDEWYKSIDNDFDCLIAHITTRMNEKGFLFTELVPEQEVEF